MGQFPTNLTAKENCDLIFNHLSNIITFLLTVSLLISLIQPLGFVQNNKMGELETNSKMFFHPSVFLSISSKDFGYILKCFFKEPLLEKVLRH